MTRNKRGGRMCDGRRGGLRCLVAQRGRGVEWRAVCEWRKSTHTHTHALHTHAFTSASTGGREGGLGVVDVGANIGACAVRLARAGHTVLALEPRASNFARLEATARLLHLQSPNLTVSARTQCTLQP